MNVQLTAEQEALISRAISDGRIHGTDEALQEALDLWTDRERARVELIASFDEAEASIARGEGRVITQESMRELAQEVKRELRARRAAEESAPR